MTFPDRTQADLEAPPPPPLMAPVDVATLLGIPTPLTPPLAGQMDMACNAVSAMVRAYCGRTFTRASYTEIWHRRDWRNWCDPYWTASLPVWRYAKQRVIETPIIEITALLVGETTLDAAAVHMHRVLGDVYLGEVLRAWPAGDISITYEGGYDPLPPELALVFVDLVRRQLLAWGASIGGTGPVARSVAVGALRVDLAVVSAPGDFQRSTQGALSATSLAEYAATLDRYATVRHFISTGA
jgi:hypothetical protein